jgi:hypothetical protein
MEDGGRLAPMAAELVDRLAILVDVRRFPSMGAALALVPCALAVISECIILFADLLLFRFGVFGGMCDVNSCHVFLLLFMALLVPISATLFKRAVLMMWHAFLFPGLIFSSFLLFAWWPPLFFL